MFPAEQTMHEYDELDEHGSEGGSEDSEAMEASRVMEERRIMHEKMIRHVRSTIFGPPGPNSTAQKPHELPDDSNSEPTEASKGISGPQTAMLSFQKPAEGPSSSTAIDCAIREQSGIAGACNRHCNSLVFQM
jgi:hypothetical protein